MRAGTRRDALLHSLNANADHGYRRTTDDKHRAIDIMLADPEWANWSSSEIARRCAVDEGTVRNRRKALAVSSEIPKIDARLVTRGGTTYQMNTAELFSLDIPPNVPTSQREPETPLDVFDWDAGRLRDLAMGAIRTIAKLPPPEEVIAAWMKSYSYGEPQDTLDAAKNPMAGRFRPAVSTT